MHITCRLRYIKFANAVIDVCLASLTVLMAAWYAVCFTILDELCPRLMEMKGNIRIYALFPNGKNPRIVAWACILP